jgi:HK97 family phage major capsid protein
MNFKDLENKRYAIAKELRALVDKTPAKKWDARCQEKYDSYIREIDSLDDSKEIAHKILNAAKTGHPGAELFNQWAIDPASIVNTMSTGTGSEGGFTVPNPVYSTILEAMNRYSRMRKVATVVTESTGAPKTWPSSDLANETAEQVAENAQAASQDPTFGFIDLPTYKFSSKIITVPIELLQDSTVDFSAWISERAGRRFAVKTNELFTVGSGTGEPMGIVTASGAGVIGQTGQTNSLTANDLVELQKSIDEVYSESPGVGWLMSRDTLAEVKKLTQVGTPLFLPARGVGEPDTLLGDPVTTNRHMAAMSASAKPIVYGDLSQFIIRDGMEMQMFRFTDSKYLENGQIGFLAFMRTGSNLADPAAVKHYQNSAT